MITVTLNYFQFLDLLKVLNVFSKYIELFWQGFKDSFGFLILFAFFVVYFALIYHVLGVMMDDGGNYELGEEGYDTKHNEYAFINYFAVNFLSSIRSSVGDLVSPTYDNWVGRYTEQEQESLSQFYIALIWLIYFMQILLFVVFFLNYLIAIVSDSFSNVIENQAMAVQNGNHALNGDYLRSSGEEAEQDIEMIVMATSINKDAGAEW